MRNELAVFVRLLEELDAIMLELETLAPAQRADFFSRANEFANNTLGLIESGQLPSDYAEYLLPIQMQLKIETDKLVMSELHV